jgi:DNA mismatch repair protein MutS
MALIKEYFELTQQYLSQYGENTILLMQVGSFFEVYALLDKATDAISGSKIEDFSRMCDLNIAEKNSSIGKDAVLMAGFKDNGLDKYVKKIQEAGYTSVVYTQEETDIAGKFIRKCAGVYSPGTFFNNDTTVLTNNTTCIWIELVGASILKKEATIIVGISNIDIYTGKTSVFEFSKKYINNPTTYDELERFISIYNPSEAIIITNLAKEKEIDDIINFANIKCDLIHRIHLTEGNGDTHAIIKAKNCEKQTYQHELLRRFYGLELDRDNIYLFNEHNVATQSFCFLLDFMYQHSPHLVNKIHKPAFENCSNRLVLANHSLKQLNIIDDQNYNGRHSSVLKMLNLCITPMGKRSFAYNFLHPTTDVSFLQREYDITEYILSFSLIESQNIKTNLSEIRDIAKWERQVFMKKISPKSFASLYKNIGIIRNVYDIISEDRTIMEYLNHSKLNTDAILNFIRTNINIELAKDIDQLQGFDINFINKNVNPKLDEAQELLLESTDKLISIRAFLNSLIERGEKKTASSSSSANEYVKIHETDKNHFSLISTSRRSKILEDLLPARSEKVENLTYISSYTGESKTFAFTFSKKNMRFEKHTGTNNFISNNEIVELCRNIHDAKVALKEIITSVYHSFISQFEEFQKQLEKIIEFITLIDMIYAKATIARKYGYCKPVLNGTDDSAKKSFVSACDLRHCLIEQLQQSEIYIANDIALGKSDSDIGVDGILLYGTNAVGKTSLIRALGIAVIMAQSGLFVPCSQFTFKPYKYIFTRILGNDNIFKGLSTFAVEMSELRTILNYADENSLILGDELCSGTENTSAVSIFVAGIQKMATMRSSFIFATHLHEIVGYDEIIELKTVSLKHMSVIYNREKDCLEYDRKLRDGAGNSMYGLEVCKSLNLPPDFLDAAYAIREKYANTGTKTDVEGRSILSLKTSHYNSRKIMGLCEKCGKLMGKEVHHLEHQKEANADGIIVKNGVPFHKNIAANLMTVCEKCHDDFHVVISVTKSKPKRKSSKQLKIV